MNSIGKPSCGAITASNPFSVPTNSTRDAGRRRRIARAMAIAGKTWPPVPPPARTNVSVSSRISRDVLGDVQQNSRRQTIGDERRAAVREERQRNPLRGEEREDD